MGTKNTVASLGELTFSLLKYRFSLCLFKSVLLHQFTHLAEMLAQWFAHER